MTDTATHPTNPLLEVSADRPIEALRVEDVCRALATSPLGLEQSEAERRLLRFGPNLIREVREKSLLFRFLGNFIHLMAILLWAGCAVAFLAHLPQLAFAIAMVNVINGAFSFWQEYKAEKAVEALRRLLPAWANVVRDGRPRRIPAEQLVPGDLIVLAEGERISADARLIEDSELRVDQSTLTGEAQHVHKTSEAVPGSAPARANTVNLVFAGTNVASGTGKAVVFATGMETAFGDIARFTQSAQDEPSPLQKELNHVTRLVSIIAVGVGLIFFVLAIFLVDIDLAKSFIFAMGMIVAFVPEGLLPTVTLSLAMSVQRMAARYALVKRLSSVETLGSATVICTDKTGTLTQNEMTVRSLWLAGRRLAATGVGYTPKGQILDGKQPLSGSSDGDLRRLLVAAGLCNNSRLLPPDAEASRWRALGDATEAALKVAALIGGVDPDAESRHRPRLREIPFESRRKRMSTIHKFDGDHVAYTKGAPGEILSLCCRVLMGGEERPLDDACRARILQANDEFASSGLRVLAIAERTMPVQVSVRLSDYTPEAVERDLTFIGLVAMMDPPRQEVAEAVEKCRHAGIRIIMITGDYGLTAESIARRIGIIQEARPLIVTGGDLDRMDEHALREVFKSEVVFARVAPEHKLRIVLALQGLGHVVAVTGDGVNDAPALKKADIGVAMGISGTDVAKEAADMILLDDNFASIVNAIEEGRAVYANIKKFTAYIFTSNTPEAVPFILYALSRAHIPLALNVMHILAIDLGTDIMPALALGAEQPEPGLMDRPPRSMKEHVITPSLLLRAYLWLGPIQSLAVMAAFYFQYWTNGYWGRWLDLPSSGPLYDSATAMALACVVTTQIGNLFAQRTERSSVVRVGLFSNRLIWLGIGCELMLIGLIVYVPLFQNVFGTAAFSFKNWGFLFALAPSLLLADELRKALLRRRGGSKW